MNRQIRRLGLALLVLFCLMFVQLNVLQVWKASELANHPGNSRNAVRDFGQARGRIITADGRVIAESIRNPDRSSKYEYLRRYPGGVLYSHVTGFFSFTYGSTGVERSYNAQLAGRRTALTARRLKDLLTSTVTTNDVILTIDDRVQRTAARALGRRRGSVVALDPRTGAILALVSYPGYDPAVLAGTDFAAVQKAYEELDKTENKPLLARAYRERFPPGSTFKVITASTGLATDTTGVDEPLYPLLKELPLPYTDRPLKNFGGKECGGSMADSFRVSCNTTFAQLGLDLGADRLFGGAKGFGFTTRPPLDLSPGAAVSVFPEPPFFVRNDPALAQAAIGQGEVAATPLEMALVASAIANRGVIMAPHVLQQARDADGGKALDEPVAAWRRAVSSDVARELNALMVSVVQGGTGTGAALGDAQVAAKTGTAQTANSRAHAWTIAFAPADAPRVAVAVIVEDQPEVRSTTGGRIAAPVAREVLAAGLRVTAR